MKYAVVPVKPTADMRQAVPEWNREMWEGYESLVETAGDTPEAQRLRQVAHDLEVYAQQTEDARYWGGPTIWPTHPITQKRAFQIGLDIFALLGRESTK